MKIAIVTGGSRGLGRNTVLHTFKRAAPSGRPRGWTQHSTVPRFSLARFSPRGTVRLILTAAALIEPRQLG